MQAQQLLSGRYRLTEMIGSGGMSIVWQARDEVLNRTVAVKVLAGPEAADGLVRHRMLAEAQAAATITHPNLINVHDYGESLVPSGEPVPFVVMELLTGPTLRDLDVAHSLATHEALAICAQIASALAALHEHGLVHRDIKPSNVILTPTGPKVLDFGIAAATGAPDELDARGQIFGTPAYLAPERLRGDDVSPATDVYALGVLTYWLLTHHLPWPTTNPAELIQAHLTAEPLPLPPIDGVPSEVGDICRDCLDKDPDRRPSAADVATALTTVVQRAAVERDVAQWAAEHKAIAAAEARTAGRRRRTSLLAASAIVAVLFVLLAVLPSILRQSHTSGQAAAPSATPGRLPQPPNPRPSELAQPTGATTSLATTRLLIPVPGTPGAFRTEIVTVPVTVPPSTIITTVTTTVAGTNPPPPPPPGQTLTAIGGTIHVHCQGNTATLIATRPAPGFNASDAGGPSTEVRVRFTAAAHESEIRARCGPAGLVPTIKETPSP